MLVLHISTSDIEGGAARASFRLNQALNNNNKLDIKSSMRVLNMRSDDKTVFTSKSKIEKYKSKMKNIASIKIQRLQKSTNNILHSSSIFSSSILHEINNSKADIIHLHWIQGEMLSIEDIGKIKKKIIWTFHDAWPFCGSEHYPNGLEDKRYVEGYFKNNRNSRYSGIDLDKRAWERKRKYWKRKNMIVCPSQWLKSCVKSSKLMSKWPVYLIPHALPLNIYKPMSREFSREIFNLPKDKILILFGALNATSDKRKGWSLLKKALEKISHEYSSYEAVVFGSSEPVEPPKIGMPINYVGRIYDDQTLALLYCAADVMVVPSYMESFGQTASEAQSCGLPVVAFDSTGLKDIVLHKKTGYLAKPYYWEDIYKGIKWVVLNDDIQNIRKKSRLRSEELWSPDLVSGQYYDLYKKLLS